MLAYQESLIVLISSQPPHVQHDPVGESRDSVFIRRFVGTSRVKLLPSSRPTNPFDGDRLPDCRNPLEEQLFQEVRGFLTTTAPLQDRPRVSDPNTYLLGRPPQDAVATDETA
jgi:hypothetical protein